MENEGNNNSPKRGEGARFPPKRGQVKVRIFTEVANKVKAAASVVGFLNKKKGDGGNSSSTTTTPPQSAYTSEGHSDSSNRIDYKNLESSRRFIEVSSRRF